jgi:hypothetical protein
MSFLVPAAAHAVCGDGVVDPGEQCDEPGAPNSCCTNACTFRPLGFVCRPSSGACDLAEACPGTSSDCGPDIGPRDTDADGVCDALDICPFLANPDQRDQQICIAQPLKKADAAARARFSAGALEFDKVRTVARGLGPVFNGADCSGCHSLPFNGGAGDRFVTRFGRYENGIFDPMTSAGGSLVQANGINTGPCAVSGEVVPPEATVSTRRITTPLFGAGLVQAIPDATILSHADAGDADGDGISGRPNVIGGGAIGRFGWKAQIATLHEFAGDALLNEMGVTSPEFPNESNPQGGAVVCDGVPDPEDDGSGVTALTDFMTMLAPLKPAKVGGSGRGKGLFRKIGCDGCHVMKMKTGDSLIKAFRKQPVPLFSDLLLHDMGSSLADGIEQGDATGSEFRTAPLWGVGRRHPYLHDGRATTLRDAVMAHGGEAQAIRDAFAALEAQDQAAIVLFLSSL